LVLSHCRQRLSCNVMCGHEKKEMSKCIVWIISRDIANTIIYISVVKYAKSSRHVQML
jgi:hypothetical protein